jgi:SAM-dependent methyltransferase
MDLALLIVGIVLALLIFNFGYGGLRAAPWVPTHTTDMQRFLARARLTPGQKFYDLGCGDGRILVAAAKHGAQAEGFEISLLPYLAARWRVFRSKIPAKIHFKDFWFSDLRNADIVYVFLTPPAYPRLKNKLEQELRPGTKVLCYVWPIEGWQPVAVDTSAGQPKLYLYTR